MSYNTVLRLPKSLKEIIKEKAKQDGISLNQWLLYKIVMSIGKDEYDTHDLYRETKFKCVECGKKIEMHGAIGSEVFLEVHKCNKKTSNKNKTICINCKKIIHSLCKYDGTYFCCQKCEKEWKWKLKKEGKK